METLIEVKNLTKDYGQGRGVFNVSFHVKKGECFGFLGPNGAGKSTTIRHIMGFSIPDSGETLLRGYGSDTKREKLMYKVAYVPGEVAMPKNLTGQEIIDEQIKLKKVKDLTKLNYLMNYFEVDPKLEAKDMSLGMKRKIALVCAFSDDPDIIILDEPSSGLDIDMQAKFIDYILELKKEGKTILLSSHMFSEVDACCDRIAIIKDGKIVSNFDSNELKHKSRKEYILTMKSMADMDKLIKSLIENKYEYTILDKEKFQLSIYSYDQNVNEFISLLSNFDIEDFREKKETLEEFFMSFYKEDLNYASI